MFLPKVCALYIELKVPQSLLQVHCTCYLKALEVMLKCTVTVQAGWPPVCAQQLDTHSRNGFVALKIV